ncbi:MAG: hypothetical protein Q4C58_07900 [Eubacteriales bacterium]|nr:hypothetical protein [Eubacteriales bacterium]
MMKEYGGYLPLELREGHELFDTYNGAKVARFNSGRASIAAAVKSVHPQKLYIPYYNCAVVRETLAAEGVDYEYYYLDENLEPAIEIINTDEWLIYVHYFGIASEEKMKKIADKYKNVIFDNTQAFFAKPILDGNCMNVYSPRKFVGLIDGGYLVWSGEREVSEDYPQDISWERGGFLLKSLELGTNAAYKDNLDSKVCLADGIKRMSVLTRRMLKSLDYDDLAEKRDRNYRVLVKKFEDVNLLKVPMQGFAPFVYPLVIENSDLRRRVVEKKIYVPQWWKYLLDEVPEDSIESWLSQWLLPLPVDHRYNENDMEDMASIIFQCLK